MSSSALSFLQSGATLPPLFTTELTPAETRPAHRPARTRASTCTTSDAGYSDSLRWLALVGPYSLNGVDCGFGCGHVRHRGWVLVDPHAKCAFRGTRRCLSRYGALHDYRNRHCRVPAAPAVEEAGERN